MTEEERLRKQQSVEDRRKLSRANWTPQDTSATATQTENAVRSAWHAAQNVDVDTASGMEAYIWSNFSGKERDDAYSMLDTAYMTPGSKYYDPYRSQATNQEYYNELRDMGVQVPEVVTSDWLAQMAQQYQPFYNINKDSGNPNSPGTKKGVTDDQKIAYDIFKLWGDEDTTQKAETEWADMKAKVTYWAQKGLSDKEIKDKLDMKKYPTLSKIDESRKVGNIVTLNRKIGYSSDAIDGVIWKARNGYGDDMDDFQAAVHANLGHGLGDGSTPRQVAQRTIGTSEYNPYIGGSNDDDARMTMGIKSWDNTWLKAHQQEMYANGQGDLWVQMDKELGNYEAAKKEYDILDKWVSDYNYGFEANTYQEILDHLKTDLEDRLSNASGLYFDDIDGAGKLTTLTKMDEGRRTGKPIGLSNELNYRSEDVLAEMVQRYFRANGVKITGAQAQTVVNNAAELDKMDKEAGVQTQPEQPTKEQPTTAPSTTVEVTEPNVGRVNVETPVDTNWKDKHQTRINEFQKNHPSNSTFNNSFFVPIYDPEGLSGGNKDRSGLMITGDSAVSDMGKKLPEQRYLDTRNGKEYTRSQMEEALQNMFLGLDLNKDEKEIVENMNASMRWAFELRSVASSLGNNWLVFGNQGQKIYDALDASESGYATAKEQADMILAFYEDAAAAASKGMNIGEYYNKNQEAYADVQEIMTSIYNRRDKQLAEDAAKVEVEKENRLSTAKAIIGKMGSGQELDMADQEFLTSILPTGDVREADAYLHSNSPASNYLKSIGYDDQLEGIRDQWFEQMSTEAQNNGAINIDHFALSVTLDGITDLMEQSIVFDAKLAESAGMTLEEYYQKTGNSLNLEDRFRQAKASWDAREAPENRTEQQNTGIGLLAAWSGMKLGTFDTAQGYVGFAQDLYDLGGADTYQGVKRDWLYQMDYLANVTEGRSTYRTALLAYANSLNESDPNRANMIRTMVNDAMANGEDIFNISFGIDMDKLKNAYASLQNLIDVEQEYVDTHATEGEKNWVRWTRSSVSSLEKMGVSAALSLIGAPGAVAGGVAFFPGTFDSTYRAEIAANGGDKTSAAVYAGVSALIDTLSEQAWMSKFYNVGGEAAQSWLTKVMKGELAQIGPAGTAGNMAHRAAAYFLGWAANESGEILQEIGQDGLSTVWDCVYHKRDAKWLYDQFNFVDNAEARQNLVDTIMSTLLSVGISYNVAQVGGARAIGPDAGTAFTGYDRLQRNIELGRQYLERQRAAQAEQETVDTADENTTVDMSDVQTAEQPTENVPTESVAPDAGVEPVGDVEVGENPNNEESYLQLQMKGLGRRIRQVSKKGQQQTEESQQPYDESRSPGQIHMAEIAPEEFFAPAPGQERHDQLQAAVTQSQEEVTRLQQEEAKAKEQLARQKRANRMHREQDVFNAIVQERIAAEQKLAQDTQALQEFDSAQQGQLNMFDDTASPVVGETQETPAAEAPVTAEGQLSIDDMPAIRSEEVNGPFELNAAFNNAIDSGAYQQYEMKGLGRKGAPRPKTQETTTEYDESRSEGQISMDDLLASPAPAFVEEANAQMEDISSGMNDRTAVLDILESVNDLITRFGEAAMSNSEVREAVTLAVEFIRDGYNRGIGQGFDVAESATAEGSNALWSDIGTLKQSLGMITDELYAQLGELSKQFSNALRDVSLKSAMHVAYNNPAVKQEIINTVADQISGEAIASGRLTEDPSTKAAVEATKTAKEELDTASAEQQQAEANLQTAQQSLETVSANRGQPDWNPTRELEAARGVNEAKKRVDKAKENTKKAKAKHTKAKAKSDEALEAKREQIEAEAKDIATAKVEQEAAEFNANVDHLDGPIVPTAPAENAPVVTTVRSQEEQAALDQDTEAEVNRLNSLTPEQEAKEVKENADAIAEAEAPAPEVQPDTAAGTGISNRLKTEVVNEKGKPVLTAAQMKSIENAVASDEELANFFNGLNTEDLTRFVNDFKGRTNRSRTKVFMQNWMAQQNEQAAPVEQPTAEQEAPAEEPPKPRNAPKPKYPKKSFAFRVYQLTGNEEVTNAIDDEVAGLSNADKRALASLTDEEVNQLADGVGKNPATAEMLISSWVDKALSRNLEQQTESLMETAEPVSQEASAEEQTQEKEETTEPEQPDLNKLHDEAVQEVRRAIKEDNYDIIRNLMRDNKYNGIEIAEDPNYIMIDDEPIYFNGAFGSEAQVNTTAQATPEAPVAPVAEQQTAPEATGFLASATKAIGDQEIADAFAEEYNFLPSSSKTALDSMTEDEIRRMTEELKKDAKENQNLDPEDRVTPEFRIKQWVDYKQRQAGKVQAQKPSEAPKQKAPKAKAPAKPKGPVSSEEQINSTFDTLTEGFAASLKAKVIADEQAKAIVDRIVQLTQQRQEAHKAFVNASGDTMYEAKKNFDSIADKAKQAITQFNKRVASIEQQGDLESRREARKNSSLSDMAYIKARKALDGLDKRINGLVDYIKNHKPSTKSAVFQYKPSKEVLADLRSAVDACLAQIENKIKDNEVGKLATMVKTFSPAFDAVNQFAQFADENALPGSLRALNANFIKAYNAMAEAQAHRNESEEAMQAFKDAREKVLTTKAKLLNYMNELDNRLARYQQMSMKPSERYEALTRPNRRDDIHPTDTTEARVSPIKAFQRLANDIHVGHYDVDLKNVPRRALGYYNPFADAIGVRRNHANDVYITMHEIGHALEERIGFTGTDDMERAADPALMSQYANRGPAVMRSEAVAEFVRTYMMDRNSAVNVFGQDTVNRFENAAMAGGIWNQIRRCATDIHAYVAAPVSSQTQARMTNYQHTRQPEGLRNLIHDGVRDTVMHQVDDTFAARDFDIAAAMGRDAERLTVRQRLRLMKFSARQGRALITQRYATPDNQITMPSWQDAISRDNATGDRILSGDEDFDLLARLWVLKQAKTRYDNAIAELGPNPTADMIRQAEDNSTVFGQSITIQEIENEIHEIEHNHNNVAKAQRQGEAWWHQFMRDWMPAAGISSDVVEDLIARYPHYCPTQRDMPNGKNGKSTTGGRTSNWAYGFRSIRGSDLDIINPLVTMQSTIVKTVEAARKNEALGEIVHALETSPDLGEYAHIVTGDTERLGVRAATLEEALDAAAARAIADGMNVDIAQVGTLGAYLEDITQYNRLNYTNDPSVIAYQHDGRITLVKFDDPALYDAVISGNKEIGWMAQKLGHLTRNMSLLTTGMNILFTAKNLVRDYQQGTVWGSWNSSVVSPLGLAKWISAAVEVATNGRVAFGEHGHLAEYQALGGEGYGSINMPTSEAEANDLLRNLYGMYGMNVAQRAGHVAYEGTIGLIDRFNGIIEQTTRYVEYKYGRHDLTTPEGRERAFLAAQDATVDFARKGNSKLAAELRAMIPFYNASLQGTWQIFDAATDPDQRNRVAVRAAKLAVNNMILGAMAYMALQSFGSDEDKEWYEKLPLGIRLDNIIIPFKDSNTKARQFIRIPVAQNWASRTFYAVGQALARGNNGDEDGMDILAVAGNILNNWVQTDFIFAPEIAVLTNKSWTGDTILNSRLASSNMRASEKFNQTTPEIFKIIARGLSQVGMEMSPVHIQYLAQQHSGILGQVLIPMMSPDAIDNHNLNPIGQVLRTIRNSWTIDPAYTNDVNDAYYDGKAILDGIVEAAKSNGYSDYLSTNLSEEEAQDAVDTAGQLIGTYGAMTEIQNKIYDIMDAQKEILANSELSDEQKEAQRRNLQRDIVRLEEKGVAILNDYFEDYCTGTNPINHILFGGPTVGKATCLSNKPAVFLNDYRAGEKYITTAVDLYKEYEEEYAPLGKSVPSTILPSPSTSVKYGNDSLKLKSYSDDNGNPIQTTYNNEWYYPAYVEACSKVNWDNLSREQKKKALQNCNTAANDVAESKFLKWYKEKIKSK